MSTISFGTMIIFNATPYVAKVITTIGNIGTISSGFSGSVINGNNNRAPISGIQFRDAVTDALIYTVTYLGVNVPVVQSFNTVYTTLRLSTMVVGGHVVIANALMEYAVNNIVQNYCGNTGKRNMQFDGKVLIYSYSYSLDGYATMEVGTWYESRDSLTYAISNDTLLLSLFNANQMTILEKYVDLELVPHYVGTRVEV